MRHKKVENRKFRFKDMVSTQKTKLMFCTLFVFAIAVGAVSAHYALYPNWDDICFNIRAKNILREYGFFPGLLKFVLHQDLKTELRTY